MVSRCLFPGGYSTSEGLPDLAKPADQHPCSTRQVSDHGVSYPIALALEETLGLCVQASVDITLREVGGEVGSFRVDLGFGWLDSMRKLVS